MVCNTRSLFHFNANQQVFGSPDLTHFCNTAASVVISPEPTLTVSKGVTWTVTPVSGNDRSVRIDYCKESSGGFSKNQNGNNTQVSYSLFSNIQSQQLIIRTFSDPGRRPMRMIGLVKSSHGPLFLYQCRDPNQIVAYNLRSKEIVNTIDNSHFDSETDHITEGGIVQVRPQQFTVTPFFGEHVYRRSAGFEQQFVAARLLPGGSGHPEEQKVIVWDNAGHFFSFYRHNLQRSMDGSLRLPLDATCSFLELPEMAGRLLLLSLGNSAPGTLRICDTLADGLVGPPIEAFDHPHPITNMKVVQANRDGFTVRISHTRGERILTRAELYQHLPRG